MAERLSKLGKHIAKICKHHNFKYFTTWCNHPEFAVVYFIAVGTLRYWVLHGFHILSFLARRLSEISPRLQLWYHLGKQACPCM